MIILYLNMKYKILIYSFFEKNYALDNESFFPYFYYTIDCIPIVGSDKMSFKKIQFLYNLNNQLSILSFLSFFDQVRLFYKFIYLLYILTC